MARPRGRGESGGTRESRVAVHTKTEVVLKIQDDTTSKRVWIHKDKSIMRKSCVVLSIDSSVFLVLLARTGIWYRTGLWCYLSLIHI